MPSVSTTVIRHRTIGIDLAISGMQVAQIFDDGRATGKPIRFRLTSQDLRAFIAAVRTGASESTLITAVMEPTGMAWYPVAMWLTRAGVRVIRVKGQRVKALRKYLSEHAKTDATDAFVLGSIPGFGDRGLDPVHVPTAEYHALQRLTKQRHRYQELICSTRRRILDLIRWSSPALESVLPDTVTQLALAILGQLFDPRVVIAMRRDVLGRFLAKSASGNHPHSGPFIDDLVENLKAAAKETIELHKDNIDFQGIQLELAQEVDHLRLWQRHIGELERQIARIYHQVHPTAALSTIPGIGPTLAPLFVAVLGPVQRFRNVDHVRGFCGMFPVKNSSGGLETPGQRLTKSGNDRLKRALYLAADTARKIDPDLAAVYQSMMVNKGHHHKQALCAVATRLVNRIYRVLKTGQPYVLRDQNGVPITVKEGKQIVASHLSVPIEIRQSRRRHEMPQAA